MPESVIETNNKLLEKLWNDFKQANDNNYLSENELEQIKNFVTGHEGANLSTLYEDDIMFTGYVLYCLLEAQKEVNHE
jgi:hypothetical protein